MTGNNDQPKAKFRGLLECPLRKGYVEFDYCDGDQVRELLVRTEQVWGTARTGMANELGRVGGFFETDKWLIFCEATDSTYVHLTHSDSIPTRTPPGGDDAEPDILEKWSKRHRLNLQGMVHAKMMRYPHARLSLHIKRVVVTPKGERFDVRLVALVAISGG